jgi:hypothetical protein
MRVCCVRVKILILLQYEYSTTSVQYILYYSAVLYYSTTQASYYKLQEVFPY